LRLALPPNPFRRSLLARATWLWGALHVVGAVGAGAYGQPLVGPVWSSVVGALWIAGFTAFGVHTLARRRGEALFLANLGHSPLRTAALSIAWCLVLETGLQMVLRMPA
jgi:hypothetical protein